MRTKNFYLCLLLLVLGTANVWADKYYMPKSYKSGGNPRYTSLDDMAEQGAKFMIYNTAINGSEDRTGFLYNNGVKIERDKTKERDLYVYNEKYVYTLEAFDTDSDGTTDYYAIKSVTSDTYLDIDGSTLHTTPVPLYIKNWADANTAGWARSGVNYESDQYGIVSNSKIGNDVFIVSSSPTHIGNYNKQYWNGTVAGFDTYWDGHPFAFYPANEVASGDYLQDLHIFSRSDIYSAQVIWGCVQSNTNITTSDSQTTSLLIDGDASTGISTAGNYVQFYLGEAGAQNIYIYLQRSDENVPTNVEIQACNDGSSFTTVVASLATGLSGKLSSTHEVDLGAVYKYIRVVNTTADATAMALSEAYVLPKNPDTSVAVKYFDALKDAEYDIYGYASAQQFATQVAIYNNGYPNVKLLSGVPLPGNKYRIYADAYVAANDVYVNREICLDAEAEDAVLIKEQGAYAEADADARKYYEWYCEQTVDGKIVFRNVANTGLYLANNGEVSTTAYKWSFSTVETHRFGVPLKDGSGEYLTLANDGSKWVPDVAAPQNQETANYEYTVSDNDTPDDKTDDVTETIAAGVCTDFVFIPIATTSEEKKITFTAGELVKRNTTFTYNGETYTLPFSKIFVETDEMPTITLNCNARHAYIEDPNNSNSGVFVGGEKDDESRVSYDDATQKLTFNYANIGDNEILELKLQIVAPFEYGSGQLYLIRNMRMQSAIQQASEMRKTDSNIDIGDDGNDGPISTASANMYYARFTARDQAMGLKSANKTIDYSKLDAASLFYFTKVTDTETTEYYKAEIQSVVTTTKCAAPNKWDAAGDVWYVQPNRVGATNGYVIGLNQLYSANNPGGAWRSDHETDDDIIVSDDANDPGALWEFMPVDYNDAAHLLKAYIAQRIKAVTDTIIPGIANKDSDKAKKYELYAKGIATTAEGTADTEIVALVELSQKAHMLEHEVTYALQLLPEHTVRSEKGEVSKFEQPNWYYLYNVKSLDSGEKYYAKFNTKDTYMKLATAENGVLGLANMFFFEGKKVEAGTLSDDKTTFTGDYNTIADNALTFDEYLQVDVHNFFAGEDTTLVSKNELVYEGTNVVPNVSDGKQVLKEFENTLKSDEAWRITTEFYLDNVSYNAYGTCLLAASADPTKDDYAGEFQVYLKDDKSLVIKVNNKYDTYRFWHTQDNFSYIKVVISYTAQKVDLDVYNAKGVKETKTITGVTLNEVAKLTCAWPNAGVDLVKMNVERVKAMNWKAQDISGGDATENETDTWYVLPSSNETYPGLAIVAGGAKDANFGWTNVEALNQTIFSDAGNADNSTWQFVKIVEFDAHVDELLEKYSTDKCVIYNEKLSTLFRLIKKNSSYIKAASGGSLIGGKTEEAYFNEIYEAIKAYDGPMPDELKAPKPRKFYTMRPACDDSDTRLYASQLNWIVQKPESINDDGEYDSSGVWLFEGTEANDGFYELDGIMLKSLHTQSYTDAFAADKVVLNDASETAVTINPVGGCVVRFQGTDDNYLRRNAVGDTIMVGNADIIGNSHASLVFTRTGTDANTVSATVHNEFNEVMTADDSDVTGTLTSVSVESNVAFKETSQKITDAILCPDRNGNAIDSDGDIVLTFTYSNLPSAFTSFNNIGLDIHALNGSSYYNYNADGKSRKFNVAVQVGADESSLEDFGSLDEIDIAAGIGTPLCNGDDGSQCSAEVHKVWNVASNNAVKIEDNKSVVVRLTISSTDALCAGCFFGLSNIILSTEGDTWYIEEMPDGYETKIYHKTKTNSVGLSSLMLGYPAKIPAGIKLFYPVTENDLSDKFITLRSYDGTIAACTPAVMHAEEGKESETFKFYYSTEAPDDDSDKATAADDHIIIDGGLYQKVVEIAPYETEMGVADSKVYMYVTTKTAKKFYWVKENYNEDGTKSDVDFNGYIRTNANRAFLVIGSDVAGKASSFSLRFDDGIVTGILDIEEDCGNADETNGIFDLQGRKLDEISAPGIYIVNGKKVIVK